MKNRNHGHSNDTFIQPADEGSFVHAISGKSLTDTAGLEVDLTSHAPQFTPKALLAGVLSGCVCAFLALYYGLKTGITPSLNILGGVLGFGLTRLLMNFTWLAPEQTFTPQENATIQTISVAVYSIAFPAFGLASGYLGMTKEAYDYVGKFEGNRIADTIDASWWRTVVWAFSLWSFGFFIAYPLREYYVVKKRLFFPSGTATAYVISTLHASKEGAARGLAILGKYASMAFCVNMLTWEFDGLSSFPVFGLEAAKFGWTLDFDLGSFGIGMLLSPQINASMIFGALIVFAVLVPWISAHRDGSGPDDWFDSQSVPNAFVGLKAYSLFAGLAVMIVQGIWSIGEILVTVIMENMREQDFESVSDDTKLRDELFAEKGFPIWASVVGYLCCGAVTCIIHHFMFHTEWYQTLVAILVVPILACSNIEGMGRTDWDISSSYGKLMMFPIGWWNKGGSIIPSLAVCHTTISGCSTSACLMQDFKTGYLLGASPSVMFYSQVVGTIIGCIVCPSLFVLLRSAWTIPTDDPSAFITGVYAPIFRTLAVVATGSGFSALPKHCLQICLGFVVFAIVLNIAKVIAHIYAPKVVAYIPEPSAMSIGIIVPAGVPLEFFIGGMLAHLWSKYEPAKADFMKNYIASGFMSGSGFAVIIQVIVSLCGLKPNMTVTWTNSHTIDSYMGVKEWVMAALALLCVAGAICLGLYCWFTLKQYSSLAPSIGSTSDGEARQGLINADDDRLDSEDVAGRRADGRPLPRRHHHRTIDHRDSTSTDGYLSDAHIV